MRFALNEDEAALRDLMRDFATREVAKVAPTAWHERRCATELLHGLGQLGLMGLLVPEKFGGADMSTVGFVAAIEELGRVDQSIAAAWQAHTTIGTLPLLKFGTPEQHERWLRPIAEGTVLGAFGLTESGAGSDAGAVRTRARRDGEGWVISGQKMFISNAGTEMSGGVVVLARIDHGSGATERAYGTFMVPAGTSGYSWGTKLRGIGWRGLDTRELFFDDVYVPADHLIGDVGLGLKQFLSVLEVGRISVAALALSLTKAVLELALQHAQTREQFGQRIFDFQATQLKLASIATEYEAARWLVYRAAALRDAGEDFRSAAAMAKLKASSVAVWAASEAVQIHGGTGYMEETPVARFYCDAKVLEIGEGTNEIQKLVIARALDRGVT